jgi:hypothetical protein
VLEQRGAFVAGHPKEAVAYPTRLSSLNDFFREVKAEPPFLEACGGA